MDMVLEKEYVDLVNTTISEGYVAATYDMRTTHGGEMFVQIANDGLPLTGCNVRIGISYYEGATPSPSKSWGGDWYLLASLYSEDIEDFVSNFPIIEIPSGAHHVEVYFSDIIDGSADIIASLSVIKRVVI